MTGTTYWISTTLIERPPPSLILDDAGEGCGIEARAADERAIDVGLRHEGIDIIRLHAAAVEEADALRRRRRGAAADLAADGIVDLLRLSGRGGAASLMLVPLTACATASRAVKGGATTTSRPRGRATFLASAPASVTASLRVPCIFQLPAINGVRLMAPSPSARSPPPQARGVRAAPAPRGTRATRRRRSTRGSPLRASRPVGGRRPSHRPRRPSCPCTPPFPRPRRACRG